MAEKPRKNETVLDLEARIEQSRRQLSQDLSGLRYQLDFPAKIRHSFQRQTVVWMTAAAAIGLIFTLLPARRKKVYVEAKGRGKDTIVETGVVFGIVKLMTSLLKPVIVNYAIQKLQPRDSRSRKS